MGNPFLAMAAIATVAADPFAALLAQSKGSLCYTRVYDSAWLKAHKGQRVRDVRFAITSSRGTGRPMLRLKISFVGAPIYGYGECGWYAEGLNRGVQNNVLDPSFKPASGIGCHLYTDVDGGSAEEGGDFPVAWIDGGKAVRIHLPDGFGAWRSLDVARGAGSVDLAPADRIVRLDRAPMRDCDDLIQTFAPNADMDNI